MAYPFKNDADRKTLRVDVYVDDETKELLTLVAAIKKTSVSNYLRQLGVDAAEEYLKRRENLTPLN